MNWTISPAVKHDLAPARFAFEYARDFAKKLGLPWKVKVKVWQTRPYDRGYSGRTFCLGPGIGRVLVKLASELPPHVHRYRKFADMPTFQMSGGAESIVYIFAHEFRHIVGTGSGKDAEMICCRFGYAAVEAWRKQQYNHPACLI